MRIVVLGTGTEIGKTVVTTTLARGAGPGTLALKPVQSGRDRPTDAELLGAATGTTHTPLYELEAPESPHSAARKEGVSIDLGAIGRWVEAIEAGSAGLGREPESADAGGSERRVSGRIARDAQDDIGSARRAPGARHGGGAGAKSRVTLIETAGGVFSPLNATHTNADLAAVLQPAELLLVCPGRLGVLHDVAATLLGLRAAHPALKVGCIVVSAVDPNAGRYAQAEITNVVLPRTGSGAPVLLLGPTGACGVARAGGSDSDPGVFWSSVVQCFT